MIILSLYIRNDLLTVNDLLTIFVLVPSVIHQVLLEKPGNTL